MGISFPPNGKHLPKLCVVEQFDESDIGRKIANIHKTTVLTESSIHSSIFGRSDSPDIFILFGDVPEGGLG